MNEEIQAQQESLQYEITQLEKQKTQTQVDASWENYSQDDNLIKWQLEVNDILQRLYHILRGDKIKFKEGINVWEECEIKDMPVKEEGVQDILREATIYINKNLLLSFYDKIEVINDRIYSFADYFLDLIMNNAERIGLDTEEKEERYSLIVLGTVNAVESAYRRALGGKKRESLTKKTMVHQSLSPQVMMGGQRKSGGFISKLNPKNWF